jgi:hypothetical protein
MEGMTDWGTVANFSENKRILQKHLNLAPANEVGAPLISPSHCLKRPGDVFPQILAI